METSMSKTVQITRDQAVWERETFLVDVPDNIPEDEIQDYARQQLEEGNATESSPTYILDNAVEGISTEIEVTVLS